jgi:hypothetical protein
MTHQCFPLRLYTDSDAHAVKKSSPNGSMMADGDRSLLVPCRGAASATLAAAAGTRRRPPKYARLRRQDRTGVKPTQGITGTRCRCARRAVSRGASTTGIKASGKPILVAWSGQNPKRVGARGTGHQSRASSPARQRRQAVCWTKAEATNIPLYQPPHRVPVPVLHTQTILQSQLRISIMAHKTGPHSQVE